jgi:hypothetical protein
MDEALRCKETGEAKVMAFNAGRFDLPGVSGPE